MRNIEFIVFFLIFFSLYFFLNFYIFIRGWSVFPKGSTLRWIYLVLFLIISLSFVVGKFLERAWVSTFTDTLVWIGSFWFAAMLYFFLLILLIDIFRGANHFIHFFPAFMTKNPIKTRQTTMLVTIGIVIITILSGFINAQYTRIKTLKLKVNKKGESLDSLNIVMLADWHISILIGRERCLEMVNQINALKPDIILMAGDIVDSDLDAVLEYNIGDALKKLEAPLGVYACTGNHEYIGGVEKAVKYLTDHKITVLQDTLVMIDSSFYIVGREDITMSRRRDGGSRKTLEKLLANIDKSLPIIMLDHQPLHLDEAVNNGVDLQLSGHTHHGQLWPMNFVTSRIYEISFGYKQKGNTQFYVTCGAATWGPPIRLGSRPEIVNILLSFGE